METEELILLVLFFMFIASGLLMFGLMFYVGRTRIKEIDKAVYGYEMPHDSIFFLILRVPNYGAAFLWKWGEDRSGLKGKIEHFDKRFRWPFIAVLLLAVCSVSFLALGVFIEKYFGLS